MKSRKRLGITAFVVVFTLAMLSNGGCDTEDLYYAYSGGYDPYVTSYYYDYGYYDTYYYDSVVCDWDGYCY